MSPAAPCARARARRRHRQVGAGVVAVAALAVGIGIPRIATDGDDDGGDPVSVSPADTGAGLPLTGPLTFDWQTTAGGLSGLAASFQADDGTVYAPRPGPASATRITRTGTTRGRCTAWPTTARGRPFPSTATGPTRTM